MRRSVTVTAGPVRLSGDLAVPDAARGVVVFAHGSGSGRHSPRNRRVADALNAGGLGTLLVDLLSEDEEQRDLVTRELRFDIELLAQRAGAAIDSLESDRQASRLPVGCFGASTGAAAAIIAAAQRPARVAAVVSRGGRPDLATSDALASLQAPTLLIVGGDDTQVIELNRRAMQSMTAQARLEIIPGASHLFEEPGALEQVAAMARDWFSMHLGATAGE